MVEDPVPAVPPALADVVSTVEAEPAAATLLTVTACELFGDELPVSCTPSAKAVKPVVPIPCESEGAVGRVRVLL